MASDVFQVDEVKKMKIGDPLDRSTDHGPQNHKAHLDKLVEYCQRGVKEGATLVCGGRQVQRAGRAGTAGGLRPVVGPHYVAARCVCRVLLRAHGVHRRTRPHVHRPGGVFRARHDRFEVQERVSPIPSSLVCSSNLHVVNIPRHCCPAPVRWTRC